MFHPLKGENTPMKVNIATENQWLEDYTYLTFLLGFGLFSGVKLSRVEENHH